MVSTCCSSAFICFDNAFPLRINAARFSQSRSIGVSVGGGGTEFRPPGIAELDLGPTATADANEATLTSEFMITLLRDTPDATCAGERSSRALADFASVMAGLSGFGFSGPMPGRPASRGLKIRLRDGRRSL
jgi:hypothetical protein